MKNAPTLLRWHLRGKWQFLFVQTVEFPLRDDIQRLAPWNVLGNLIGAFGWFNRTVPEILVRLNSWEGL